MSCMFVGPSQLHTCLVISDSSDICTHFSKQHQKDEHGSAWTPFPGGGQGAEVSHRQVGAGLREGRWATWTSVPALAETPLWVRLSAQHRSIVLLLHAGCPGALGGMLGGIVAGTGVTTEKATEILTNQKGSRFRGSSESLTQHPDSQLCLSCLSVLSCLS